MRLRVIAPLLAPLCVYWLAEDLVRRVLRLPRQDNCFTWAARNYDYWAGDGLTFQRSVSSWFPHTVIIKGMRHVERQEIVLLEYVPLIRLPAIPFPKHKFEGVVKVTRMVNSESQSVSRS